MKVILCVLLTAKPGAEAALVEYEDQVLALLGAHGARLVQRVRAVEAQDGPDEVHVIEFPSEAALQAYLDDPARLALADLRERGIADTTVVRVEDVR